MSTLDSHVLLQSEVFQNNQEHSQAQVKQLRDLQEQITQGGSQEAKARYQAQGKLLPRERLNRLIDAGSPFLETQLINNSCNFHSSIITE